MSADLESFPIDLYPMLATGGELPQGPGWSFELKWDGIRGLVGIQADGSVTVRTRSGNDATAQFPELAALSGPADGHALLLDGEIITFDANGKPSFQRLQGRLGLGASAALIRAHSIPVLLVIFDLLHLDGYSTRRLPLENRRTLLERLGLGSGPQWHISTPHDDGQLLQAITRETDQHEGVVAKRLDSPYLPGVRTKNWIKRRNLNIDTFVIGGWIPGDGRRQNSIGSLLIGTPTDDKGSTLQSVGRVGTGFTDYELGELLSLLQPLVQPHSPFDSDIGDRTAVFTRPEIAVSVEYLAYTDEGVLRSPSYKGRVPR